MKRIILFFKNLGLIKKLNLLYLLVLAVPIFIFGFFLFNNVESAMKNEAISRSRQSIQNSSNNINKNIQICKNAIQSIISNSKFIEFISDYREYSASELISFDKDILANLRSIKIINNDLYRVRVFIKNSFIPDIGPIIFHLPDMKNSEIMNKLLFSNEKMVWDILHKDKVELKNINTEVVSLYYEIRYPTNRNTGIIEVNMLKETFFRDLFFKDEEEESLICAVKSQGGIIYDPTNIFFHKLSITPEQLEEQLMQNVNGKDGVFYYEFNSLSTAVTYKYINTINLNLFSITSLENMNTELTKTRNIGIVVIIAAIILLSLITYLITAILLRKIKIIIENMRRVEEGELFIDISVKGNDEIDELSGHFQRMLLKINELIFKVVRKQSAAKDAEIRALHSQINAHFLYNVLESIKMMAEIDEKFEISDALTSLGRLMRYSLGWKKQYVLLNKEIEHIQNYIHLLNIRYDNEIILKLEISEIYYEHEIPKMILQPVIENSVVHGFEKRGGGGTIVINTNHDEEKFLIIITDNGSGIDKNELDKLRKKLQIDNSSPIETADKNNGIGLLNVHERIKLIYGKEYGIDIDSEKFSYTRVNIRLPYF